MRARALSPLALLVATGCVRDLPGSPLGAGAVDLFAAFDADPAALPGIVAEMDAELASLDLRADPKDRLFDLPELAEEDFGGADTRAGLDTRDQIRAAMVGESRYGIDDNLRAQVEVNFTCANAEAVTCHERLPSEGSDAAVFLAGTAADYRTENTIRIETVPVDFWIQAPVDFRWVDLDDGRRAAVGRTWLRRPFDNDGGGKTWTQRFGIDLFVEDPDDPDRTRRFYGTWLAPTVNGVPGPFLQQAVRRGLDDGFTRPDEWLAGGETCDVDLDACLAESPF